jgi:hypothetical protein
MIDIEKFKTKHPLDKKIGDFKEDELQPYKDKIPEEVYKFLEQEQKSIYGNGFFRTVSPNDFHDVFTNWGLDGQNCYAFLRSSFGCIEFYYDGDFYRLNPHAGSNFINSPGKYFSILMNLALCNATNLEMGFCYDLHLQHKDTLGELKDDEMYTLVPSIPFGGSKETSRIEVVKMDVQLDILAQLYNHQTTD